MITKISRGTVISNGKRCKANVYYENGTITAITNEALPYDEEIDAAGNYVSPGFIDIHTHGAGGHDFLDNTEEAFVESARMHAKHGATVIVPTITSSTKESMQEAIETFRRVQKRKHDGAQMPGLHLEGPYFSVNQKGAQDERFIRPFDESEYREIIGTGCVLRWTGAPELDGAEEFAGYLKEHGVLASIGHSDADCQTVRKAFADGFTHVTHLYSCTSTVHRKNAFRYAGIVEAAYLLDDMTVEIIADGIHLPGDLLEFVYKFKGRNKTALVTDSMRGAGMPEGMSILGGKKDGMPVIIEDGVAKLPDRSAFAGSVALCDRLIRTVTTLASIPLEDAVVMAAGTPASILGLKNKGDILPGCDADIVIFDETITIRKTIIGGKTVYSA
ncbi:MAG: N-acetylglucosamine-6-phosphate deacetylase [Lachnospiraceae bacterium]|nr:N-acetylglucosamine-6-phosphate deacetylase [Lachnospiraceae bacterium]